MQFYPFPTITSLDTLKPALEGREEIKVMDRGDYNVVDYLYVLPDTFPAIPDDPTTPEWRLAVLRRECRGIMFNKDGSLLSRRLHKFHNIGEREEMLPQNISLARNHHVLNKEDGSMLSPFLDPQEQVKWAFEQGKGYSQRIYWGTMMGWTDVAQAAEAFIKGNHNFDYEGFARDCLNAGWTPIFEWCSPKARIVLKHEREKMVLLTIRHNQTGVYKTYEDATEWASRYGIPMVESFGRIDGSMEGFMSRVRDETNTEGYVVQFDNGHCMKIKTSWYLRFHKAKENLVFEKDVWNLILEGDLDDVMPVLMDHDRARMETFVVDFEGAMKSAAAILQEEVYRMKLKTGDGRGAYAALVKANQNLPDPLKAMAFKMFEVGHRADASGLAIELIRNFAANSVTSASKIEEAREIIKVGSW